jgi:ankyrin repeat protein
VLQQKCEVECRARNYGNDGHTHTSMYYVAINGNDECLKCLIEAGANVNCKDIGEDTFALCSIKR